MARITMADSFANVTDIVGKAKKIANNTFRYTRKNGDTAYRLHKTDIAVEHVDGAWTLNTGGWFSVTTKARLNDLTPFNVWSDRGIWYIGEAYCHSDKTKKQGVFWDGMSSRDIGLAKGDKHAVAQKAMLKRITVFVKLVDIVDELPQPSPGDCFICQSGGAADCLESHMDEGYLHGTLLVNAMRFRKYPDHSIGLHYQLNTRDTFKRALRAYLKFHLLGNRERNFDSWQTTRAA